MKPKKEFKVKIPLNQINLFLLKCLQIIKKIFISSLFIIFTLFYFQLLATVYIIKCNKKQLDIIGDRDQTVHNIRLPRGAFRFVK